MQLGDFLTLQRGFDITKKEQRPGPYWVISSSGPSSRHAECRVRGPGVVIGRKGSLGGVYFSQADFWPHDTTLWVKDFKDNDPLFSYYLLKTLGLERFDVGAANPTLNRNHLHLLSVSAPPRPEQRRIAAVLAAYDESIENNLRRIEILEEMAQEVYREWFINLRFPGHEDVPLVDSAAGPIPDGWSVSTLGAESIAVMGQSPKSEFYNDEGAGLPFHQGVTNFGPLFPQHTKHCTVEARIAEAGDTLVSVRAPVGRINVADTRMVIGRGLAAIRAADEFPGFHFRQLRHVFREEDSMGGGTIYKAITKGDLLGISWLVPPVEMKAAFDSLERPMFALMANLTRQTAILRSTRDLLLPKLVSGEIDVSELDIETEWLAS